MVVVSQVPSPPKFVANHPGGSAGAVTLSQFSVHGGPAEGLGLAPMVAVGLGPGVTPAVAVGVAVPAGVGVETGPAAKSYASTKPTPVLLFTPESKAVYWPGARIS